MPWRDVCLSVRLSHAGIESKRIDILKVFRRRVAPPFYTVFQKNAPTLADYNYDPVQSI